MTEVYSPNATWSKVKAAAQDANIFIYLGHGNGSPSPYGAFSPSAQGRPGPQCVRRQRATQREVLRASTTSVASLDLANNSVVILNRLCYASGNSEWGARPHQVHGHAASGQLRDRLPAGRREGGLRQRHRQRLDSISRTCSRPRTVGGPDLPRRIRRWSGSRDFGSPRSGPRGRRSGWTLSGRPLLPLGVGELTLTADAGARRLTAPTLTRRTARRIAGPRRFADHRDDEGPDRDGCPSGPRKRGSGVRGMTGTAACATTPSRARIAMSRIMRTEGADALPP